MFKNVQIGEDVWDVRYGWGKVVELNESTKYPFSVDFLNSHNNKQNCSYSIEGRSAEWHNFPLLFWNEFKIPLEAFIKPLPKLEVDTKVLVWKYDDDYKRKRYFSHFNKEGKIYCYEQGCTSWSATTTQAWDNYEIYKEQQC